MKDTQVVAFDCDGVMFDSVKANTAYYNHILEHFGLPAMTAEQFVYANMHTAEKVLAFLFQDPELRDAALAYRREMSYRPFVREMEIEPYLKPLLQALRPRYYTAVATNRTDSIGWVISDHGLDIHRSTGQDRTVLGVIGSEITLDPRDFELLEGVSEVVRVTEPFKLASRTFKPESTVITVGDLSIGGNEIVVMAGPCSIESESQISEIAEQVASAGAKVLRGGAFKPRTNPYSFQGLGEDGLRYLREAADRNNLLTVTEVMDASQVGLVSEYSDILQIGARNMHNFAFLRELGNARKPIFLKRGMSATIEEWLQAAEYVLSGGNGQVILCERGIRTFETYTRNTLDISAIPVVHKLSHLPIFADPSHGTGRRDKVAPMARAAVAAGADGLMIEVHNDPDSALSDGAQSLLPGQFSDLMGDLKQIAPLLGRTL